ncbi:MAG: AzlC family ABC transporter permease [Desulfovibrionaceae bacterium]|nr:AzlC family ABC transporter permease [Desulfovibrionaceae bacterium]
MRNTSSTALWDGVKRALPIVLGYVPVAFAFGVLAVKNAIPPGLAIAMSVFLFAGSGQFVAVSLWGAGVGAASVVLTVFVVNLRHLLMSASLAPYLKPMTRLQKFFFGYELTDETFGVHSTAFQRGWTLVVPTLYACNVTAHASWIGGTVAGVFFGGLIADVKPLGLDYALTAMFLALLVPQCRSRLHVLVALAGATLSVGLSLAGVGQWNVVVATVPAAALGAALQTREKAA